MDHQTPFDERAPRSADIQSLLREMRRGLCVEADRCRSIKTADGCGCAKIADLIETLADELSDARAWLEVCLGQVDHGSAPPNWDGIRKFLKR